MIIGIGRGITRMQVSEAYHSSRSVPTYGREDVWYYNFLVKCNLTMIDT